MTKGGQDWVRSKTQSFLCRENAKEAKTQKNFLRFRETILRFCDINKNREGEFAVGLGRQIPSFFGVPVSKSQRQK